MFNAPLDKNQRQIGTRNYVHSLTGLRGLAILIVMLGHFTVSAPTSVTSHYVFDLIRNFGTFGVDLFFVLSGFLITGILLDTKGNEGYFKAFYMRRVLRIIPLYYGLLLIYHFMAPLVTLHIDTVPVHIMTEPIWHWLFISNFWVMSLGDFPYEPMAVSWSLAIEEQFYLVWPLIVSLCTVEKLRKVCIGMLAAAFVTRVAMVALGANAVQMYVFTLSRMDTLAVGAWLAIIWRSTPDIANLLKNSLKVLLASGALLIVIAAANMALGFGTSYASAMTFMNLTAPVFYSGLALFWGAFLVQSLNPAKNLLIRFLEHPLMFQLGLFSYGIYLTNDVLAHGLPFAHISPDELAPAPFGQLLYYLLGFTASFFVGYCCHHFVEKHFLKLKTNFVPREGGL